MQNYVEKINLIYDLYSNNGAEVVFYLMVFIVMLCITQNQKMRNYILYPILVELLFIFNPVSIAVFVNTGILAETRYVRLFWMVQVSVVIGGAACECIHRIEKKRDRERLVLIGLLIGTLMLMGKYIFTDSNFQPATNLYKLPEGVIEVTDAIKEDCESEGKDLSKIRIAVPVSLAPYIRQYDGNIKMLYGRNIENNLVSATVQSLQQEELLNIQKISLYAKEGFCDYIVLEEYKSLSENPEKYSYKLVDIVKGYRIYRDTSLKQ